MGGGWDMLCPTREADAGLLSASAIREAPTRIELVYTALQARPER